MNNRELFFLFCGFTLGSIVGFVMGFLPLLTQENQRHARQQSQMSTRSSMQKNAQQQQQQQKKKKLQQDIAKLQQDLEKNPQDEKILHKIANNYFDLEQYGKAVKYYRQAQAINNDSPDLLTDLGIALKRTGKMEDAIVHFKKAQQLNPRHWQSLYNLAIVDIVHKGKNEDVRAAYQRLKSLRPNDSRISSSFALGYFSHHNYREALYYFEETLRIDPKNWQIFNYMAKAYEEENQPLKAAAAYEKILQILPRGHHTESIVRKIKKLKQSAPAQEESK